MKIDIKNVSNDVLTFRYLSLEDGQISPNETKNLSDYNTYSEITDDRELEQYIIDGKIKLIIDDEEQSQNNFEIPDKTNIVPFVERVLNNRLFVNERKKIHLIGDNFLPDIQIVIDNFDGMIHSYTVYSPKLVILDISAGQTVGNYTIKVKNRGSYFDNTKYLQNNSQLSVIDFIQVDFRTVDYTTLQIEATGKDFQVDADSFSTDLLKAVKNVNYGLQVVNGNNNWRHLIKFPTINSLVSDKKTFEIYFILLRRYRGMFGLCGKPVDVNNLQHTSSFIDANYSLYINNTRTSNMYGRDGNYRVDSIRNITLEANNFYKLVLTDCAIRGAECYITKCDNDLNPIGKYETKWEVNMHDTIYDEVCFSICPYSTRRIDLYITKVVVK